MENNEWVCVCYVRRTARIYVCWGGESRVGGAFTLPGPNRWWRFSGRIRLGTVCLGVHLCIHVVRI